MANWRLGESRIAAVAFALLLPGPQLTPKLSVRIVDQDWRLLPGIDVRISEVDNCRTPGGKPRTTDAAVTDRTGQARFLVLSGRSYRIDAGGTAGFDKASQCVDVTGMSDPPGPLGDTAYVQLRLRADPRLRVTLLEPSVAPPERRSTLDTDAFVGVYVDAVGEAYVVESATDGAGLKLESPDGRTLFFESRRGLTFQGSGGTLTFRTTNGQVRSFSFVAGPITATLWKEPR